MFIDYVSYVFSLLFVPLCIWALVFYYRAQYMKSTYYSETQFSYWKVLAQKGLLGEYHTASVLDKIPGNHKTLVNAYIPKKKGGTTEIDIIFIHEKGIFVLESKNYSGWIYGKESDRNWTQVFKNQRKERFYNPIMQNRTHVNALYDFLKDIPKEHFHSYIIFSKHCELKKVTVTSPDIFVLKRNDFKKKLSKQLMNSANIFSSGEIAELYDLLKPCTTVTEDVKLQHIQSIKNKKKA